MTVRAKKSLGQHFLKDEKKAAAIVDALRLETTKQVLEIGPGMGVLTKPLLQKTSKVMVVELDGESVAYLHNHFPGLHDKIIEADFLTVDLGKIFEGPFAVIGNFPYNISSQILFRILDFREMIPEVVGMFQKEVAERIAGSPGGKEYGILSVFMQAYYDVDIILQLLEEDFIPPPKVKSAVLRFERKENFVLGCDEKLFRRVVKAGFNQRRKTLRNSMSAIVPRDHTLQLPYAERRPETLGWQEFTELTNAVEKLMS